MQSGQLQRREFITLLGSAAVAWPLAARAQQPTMPVVGFLHGGSPNAFARLLDAFRQGLKDAGYVEHHNVGIEYRWAESQSDRLPALAADLVRRQIAAIAAFSPPAALAAKAATSTIPIVFANGADPVELGLVKSLNRPGGNVTGVSFLINTLGSKQIELLHDLVPKAALIAALVDPNNADASTQVKHAEEAARALGLDLLVLSATTAQHIDAAFAEFVQAQAGALLVGSSVLFRNQEHQIVALAARHAVPTFYNNRDYVAAGGLISYATSIAEGYRQAGIYTGKILKGAKPTELPVVQSTKFELVINLKTAKALGLEIPPTLLAIADEVIE
jgi:putative ABC transport system substrate-binding protein